MAEKSNGAGNLMNTDAGSADGFLLMDGIEDVYHVAQAVCEAEKHPLNPVLPVGDSHEWGFHALRAVVVAHGDLRR